MPLAVGLAADFGGQHDVRAVAARGEPVAEYGLGLAALIAGGERRVGIGAVDEVAAGRPGARRRAPIAETGSRSQNMLQSSDVM
jgi:hypothetical protein